MFVKLGVSFFNGVFFPFLSISSISTPYLSKIGRKRASNSLVHTATGSFLKSRQRFALNIDLLVFFADYSLEIEKLPSELNVIPR